MSATALARSIIFTNAGQAMSKGEFEIIEKYFARLTETRAEALGLKDDAAILDIPPGHQLVVSTDTANAGTHFLVEASPADIAHKVLRQNLSDLAAMGAQPYCYQLAMVFPEGAKGFGKPFSERYRLQRFGRGGFVEVALETGTPIIPVAVVGAEEIYPKLGEIGGLARLAGVPYFPLTPTFPWLGPLGLLPLPSRWRIEFLEPIDLSGYGPGASQDRSLVFDLSEQVRETIQEGLYRGLVERGPAFL